VPFFRTHSAVFVPRREPWSYGASYERANRATIRLRYQLLPVLYTAFYQHAQTGAPVVRPVFWSALADTAALGVNDEYLLGDHLLAAPVVDRTERDHRAAAQIDDRETRPVDRAAHDQLPVADGDVERGRR